MTAAPARRAGRATVLVASLAALCVATATVALVAPAAAQPAPAPPTSVDDEDDDGPDASVDGPVRLVLSEFDGVLGPGAIPPTDEAPAAVDDEQLRLRALVENTGDTSLDELTLVVEVHPAESTRSGLRQAMDGGRLDLVGAAHVHEVPVRPDEPLAPGDIVGVRAAIDVEGVPWADDGGVHPVRIAVRRGASVLTETTTAAIWLDSPPPQPLSTTVVWPLDIPPVREAGGTYPRSTDGMLRAGGGVDAQLRALERHPAARVVLAPPAHLLEDLRDRAGGYIRTERTPDGVLETRRVGSGAPTAQRSNELLGRLRVALDASPSGPLARPYADADLGALTADEDTRGLAGELARAGRDRLEAFGQRLPEQRSFLLPPGAGPTALDLVPADTVVVPYDAIEAPDPATDPTLPSPVRDVTSAGGRPVTLLVGDPYLADLLDPPARTGPTAAAQRVLAETAMAYFEAPGSTPRALTMLPPEGWSPSTEFAQRLLGGLAAAPWLELSDPATAAAASRGPATSLVEPGDAAMDVEDRTRIVATLRDLEALWQARIGSLATADPEVESEDDGSIDDREPGALRDEVLRATSRWYPPGSATREALLADVDGAVARTVGAVSLASGTSVTLTAETGTIPITLQNTEAGPIDVVVEVASQARLTWPEGSSTEVLRLQPGTTQTVSFATRALSTGDFSVTVRVTDPSGRVELDRAALSVRSTAFSGPALSIIGGIAVVLLVVGLVRRRPSRRLEVVR